MDRLAQGGDDGKYPLPVAHISGAELDMSFSGLKTASLNLIHNAQQKGEELDLPAFAASFGRAVSDSLVPRAMAGSPLRAEWPPTAGSGPTSRPPAPGAETGSSSQS